MYEGCRDCHQHHHVLALMSMGVQLHSLLRPASLRSDQMYREHWKSSHDSVIIHIRSHLTPRLIEAWKHNSSPHAIFKILPVVVAHHFPIEVTSIVSPCGKMRVGVPEMLGWLPTLSWKVGRKQLRNRILKMCPRCGAPVVGVKYKSKKVSTNRRS